MKRLTADFTLRLALSLIISSLALRGMAMDQDDTGSSTSSDNQRDVVEVSEPRIATLDELKVAGSLSSKYRKRTSRNVSNEAPSANLAAFRNDVEPILRRSCIECHGASNQEGNIRIDTLDPDLFQGDDVDWWLEVLAVLSNGEMPPVGESDLSDGDRSKVVEWLSSQIQLASAVRRSQEGHSSFRRMTRYEYNYVLQDLLGLPYNFAKDLPPEATSEDGFQNSSELLHMSLVQFGIYQEAGLKALKKATVSGPQPDPIYWGVSMKDASGEAWTRQQERLDKIHAEHKDDPDKLKQALTRHANRTRNRPNQTHYRNLVNGQHARASWSYGGGKYAWKPSHKRPEFPEAFDHVAVIPPKQRLIVELGDTVPEQGLLRIRFRASRTTTDPAHIASLQLEFGWQASNDSQASVKISDQDLVIDAKPDEPRIYQWEIPLSEIYPRNSMRGTWKMGDLPNPSELVKFVNSSVSQVDIQIDFVEITAPVYRQWPPNSHLRIFVDSPNKTDEEAYAREVLANFMPRAWRGEVSKADIDQKLALFKRIRPECGDSQEALLEVLATVLASPRFLYLVQTPGKGKDAAMLKPEETATRLSMFLWCSSPDQELLELARSRQLHIPTVLVGQVKRMLADPRSRRFSKHFVRQWLGMQLLDFLDVDRKAYPQFDSPLKEAMQSEPIAFFQDVLQRNGSVLDFIHADYTLVNERLARHYGLNDVYGNHFRRVKLDSRRGGLLTQAGLLAMNSDGKDSHPLKRGIWMLESLLNNPPPPPPPAVPEIDLADPEIAKLTLKQRIEDHRNQAACLSCHAKIDPWGIAFENYDAVGSWRSQINGTKVDASSQLFNGQELHGMDGLKRFLLKNRQDQFVRALVHKMTTYALGRPLTFGDRSRIDQMTSEIRKQGDGLATMVEVIATSELFRSN